MIQWQLSAKSLECVVMKTQARAEKVTEEQTVLIPEGIDEPYSVYDCYDSEHSDGCQVFIDENDSVAHSVGGVS
jgi:hypothetical protein